MAITFCDERCEHHTIPSSNNGLVFFDCVKRTANQNIVSLMAGRKCIFYRAVILFLVCSILLQKMVLLDESEAKVSDQYQIYTKTQFLVVEIENRRFICVLY